MGFLEDLGRSNALGSVDRLAGKAIDIRRIEDQQEDRTLGRAIDLEQLGIAKSANEREATKFKWQEKEMKQKRAIAEMPVPITALFGVGWEKDPAKKMQYDKMKEKGLVDEVAPGVIMTTHENAQALKDYGKQDLEWTKQVNEANMVNINNQITQIGEQLVEEKNPKKIEELTQSKAMLEKKLSGYVAAHKRIDIKHQNNIELEKSKAEGKIEAIKEVYEGKNKIEETKASLRERHEKAMEEIGRIRAARIAAGAKGGGATALAKNTALLSRLGWSEKEAVKFLLGPRAMSKEAFLGKTILKLSTDVMFDSADLPNRVSEAEAIYDAMIPSEVGTTKTKLKQLDDATARSIFKEAGGDPKKAAQLAKDRGYEVK